MINILTFLSCFLNLFLKDFVGADPAEKTKSMIVKENFTENSKKKKKIIIWQQIFYCIFNFSCRENVV